MRTTEQIQLDLDITEFRIKLNEKIGNQQFVEVLKKRLNELKIELNNSINGEIIVL